MLKWQLEQENTLLKQQRGLLELYVEYVENYATDHNIKGNYPVCFDEWLDNEYEENK